MDGVSARSVLEASSVAEETVARHLVRISAATAWCVIALAVVARAQETINYASVSGRVTDPQGAVVPGAEVSARQMDTNVAADTVDGLGRPIPLPISEDWPVRGEGSPGRICRCHPNADTDDWIGIQPSRLGSQFGASTRP